MKYITSLAVLATAALMVANANASDSYSPTSLIPTCSFAPLASTGADAN